MDRRSGRITGEVGKATLLRARGLIKAIAGMIPAAELLERDENAFFGVEQLFAPAARKLPQG